MRATMQALHQRPLPGRRPPVDSGDVITCATQQARRFIDTHNTVHWNFWTQCVRYTEAWWGLDAARHLYRKVSETLPSPPPNPYKVEEVFDLTGHDPHIDAVQDRADQRRFNWGDPLYYPGIVDVVNGPLPSDKATIGEDAHARGQYHVAWDSEGHRIAASKAPDYALQPDYDEDREFWLECGDSITGPPPLRKRDLLHLQKRIQRIEHALATTDRYGWEWGLNREESDRVKAALRTIYQVRNDYWYDQLQEPDEDKQHPFISLRNLKDYQWADRMEAVAYDPEVNAQVLTGPALELYPPDAPEPAFDRWVTQTTGIRMAARSDDHVWLRHTLSTEDNEGMLAERQRVQKDDEVLCRKIEGIRKDRIACASITAQMQWANAVKPSMTHHDVINVVHLAKWHHQDKPVIDAFTSTFGKEAGLALIGHALTQPFACTLKETTHE